MSKPSTDALASWASILGSVAALLGLIQSQTWLTLVGVLFVSIAAAALLYARRERRLLENAGVRIEGLHLDSLNIANLRRRTNRSLVVQRAYHLAKVEGRDLSVSWRYDGFCRTKRETQMEFSIDTENNVPFDQLECFAFDLREDPDCLHKIRPLLVGGAGLSKKIAVPFLNPLLFQQPFSVLLNCNLPGCIGTGVQYYTSSLSFDQRTIKRLAVHLVFVKSRPDWVRVYECLRLGRPALISELRPVNTEGDNCEFIDLVEDAAGQSIRIYVYHLGLPRIESRAADLERLTERSR